MTARREALSPAERAEAAQGLAARLAGLPQVAEAQAGNVISGYVAIAGKGEIDPGPALEQARQRGVVVALPRVTAGEPRLSFHRADPGAPLQAGAFGVMEPAAGTPEVALEAIDVMLLPGLAFDRAGRRLGYGAGYYDEVAGRVRRAGHGFLIGVAYDFQLVDRCPAGAGDVAVDCVVTDGRVVRCGSQA
jgi:5-formyltetrahydrofolate cyclo-ligase